MSFGDNPELDAVNEMLAAIGEDPIGGLELMPPSANTALHLLRVTARDMQEEGHWFNTEKGYVLLPDTDGYILIPPGILRFEGEDRDVVDRGGRLYDLENKTLTFTSGVSLEVILNLPWRDLPPVARRYFTAIATERFVEAFPGSPGVTEARNRNLLRARAAFQRAEVDNANHNLLQNQGVLNMMRRS
ncbi:hypothetical protein LO749_20840 [Paracoccus denitrificans]|uniref:hypothetical protein n=1 Tax=Paracoccus denitrificans TaxID=266 RepID=UPI001E55CC47|nr:hypothetical protein [Paracoccus denitrificans]UFS66942.1 hypothetical protein LO749_20840 [Paracoccus denitrificans]